MARNPSAVKKKKKMSSQACMSWRKLAQGRARLLFIVWLTFLVAILLSGELAPCELGFLVEAK